MPPVVCRAILSTSYLIEISTPSSDSASNPVFQTAPSVLAKLLTTCHQLTCRLAVNCVVELLLLVKETADCVINGAL